MLRPAGKPLQGMRQVADIKRRLADEYDSRRSGVRFAAQATSKLPLPAGSGGRRRHRSHPRRNPRSPHAAIAAGGATVTFGSALNLRVVLPRTPSRSYLSSVELG
jgi:hypothetical protein